jgi:prepilin-type N-terminal cleavage/methylation domain-containing protein
MKNHTQHICRASKKAGLTLIELLVVLVILVAVGGLLVPTISSALARSHVSTCASTFPEVHQMMQRAVIENGDIGNNFLSGVDTAVTAADETGGINGQNVEVATADDIGSLAGLGITDVVDHDVSEADYNVTFNTGATAEAITDATALVVLTDNQAESIYLPTANGERYIWFGIGPEWSLLGDLAPEPPAHFGDTPGFLPDEVLSRFGIVVEVFDADTPAEYKRVSYSLGDTDTSSAGAEFETGDNHIGVYWTDVNAN